MTAQTDLVDVFNSVQTLMATYPTMAVNIVYDQTGVTVKLGTDYVNAEFDNINNAANYMKARVADPAGTKVILLGPRVTELEKQIVALQAEIDALNA